MKLFLNVANLEEAKTWKPAHQPSRMRVELSCYSLNAATFPWHITKGLKIWAATGASQTFRLLTHCGSLPAQLRERCGFSLVKKENQNLSKTCHSLDKCCQRNNVKKESKSEMMLLVGLSCPRKKQEDYGWYGRGVKRRGPWVRGKGKHCPWTWPKGSLRAEYSEFPLFR